jgi:hypothetical protein
VPEFERDSTQDQPRQHEKERHIKRGQKGRIDDRKGAPENHGSHHEPGFVAVPNRADGANHSVTSPLVARCAEEGADAKIETVEQHIEQRADDEDSRPIVDRRYSPAARGREPLSESCAASVVRNGVSASDVCSTP